MTEPHLPRQCPRKEAHHRHEYSFIDLHGRNIGFGQTFICEGVRGRRLTKNEQTVLAVVGAGRHAWLSFVNSEGHSPQGTHQTAASLVRKGMVSRHKGRDGVFYIVTAHGREVLRST